MSGLHFQHPERIHWLWAVMAWLASWWALRRRDAGLLNRFVGRPLHGHLVHRLSAKRRWLRFALFGVAGVALVLALMRPQWGLRFVQMPRVGAEMMVCLDVSKSMLAEDAAPSRLERAKADLSDLLGYLDGDHIGLIAFAGKATVLCPLTPDFGFYRLVLQEANPRSVARGGTNLEAALRKAVAGFRTEADVSRIIVLITDGEDHDHFPLEAAALAAERGIRVLSIGFGSESGTEIYVRDEETGARTLVRDRDGNPVRSRLDGDLLREIALKTDGAYIPAGTGALDLRSIYQAHIAPLTRGRLDGRGRPVRNEAYPWCVLAALLSVVGGVWAGTGRPRLLQRFREVGLATVLFALFAAPAHARDGDDPDRSVPLPQAARDAYNHGVQALAAGTLDRAARAFEAARSRAGTDGAVRFRSGYNLGWVEVQRANAMLESDPQTALSHLQKAAQWFQDVVRLRPERTDARQNLERIVRRIRQLADAIAKRDPRDVVQALDALIKSQRALLAELARAVEPLQIQRDDPSTRRAFRRLATEQRQHVATARSLIDRIASEQQALEETPDADRTTEQRIRAAQLRAGRSVLQQATQRLGRARSQLRRRAIGRAFVRASGGLNELKRARDQFRNPVEILDALVTDTMRLVQQAKGLVSLTGRRPPAWLTAEHVDGVRGSVRDRTEALRAQLDAGLKAPPPEPQEGEDPNIAEKTKNLRALLEQTVPLLGEAVTHLDEAHPPLKARRPTPGMQRSLGAALRTLDRARELFLDLKRLVERAYETQRVANAALKDTVNPEAVLTELGAMFQENQGRADRMPGLLEAAKTQSAPQAAPNTPADPAASEEKTKAHEAYWQVAATLLTDVRDALQDVAKTPSVEGSTRAEQALDALRRHLFTLVERLRERLREQVDLNDDTLTALAKPGDEETRKATIQRLDARQDETRTKSQAIAAALEHQAAQAAQQPMPPAPHGAASAPPQDRFRKAAAHVQAAVRAMGTAREGLVADPPQPGPVQTEQTRAAEELARALAVLEPPQEQPKDDQEQDEEKDGDEQKKKPKQQQGGTLQAVRDREAKRREKKAKQAPAGEAGVDKDW